MKKNIGKKYAGLTDDPVRRKTEHGNPDDWIIWPFSSEIRARAWEDARMAEGYVGGTGGGGWRYGYMYTITPTTIE